MANGLYLSPDDLQDVLTDLEPAKAQWNNLGLGLKVRRTDLEAIKNDHRNSLDCLRAVIEIWLDTVDPRPTWKAVIAALRSPLLARLKTLADDLEKKHCSGKQPTKPVAAGTSRGDRELREADAYEVSNYLAALQEDGIHTLGLALGLSMTTLSQFRKQPTFLDDMLLRWLQGKDQVMQRGGHTWNALVKALREPRVNQTEIAQTIEDAECT